MKVHSPRVQLGTLEKLAALIWVGVGCMLAVRGWRMLNPLAQDQPLSTGAWLIGGLILGAAKGHYVLWNSALRNRRRLRDLPEPRLHLVFAPTFWPLIGLMILFGAGLRYLASLGALSHGFVGSVYVGIGAALLASSFAYRGLLVPPIDTSVLWPDPILPPPTPASTGPGPHGLLVVNLGTPASPNRGAVRRYLTQFLSDPRVVRLPRLLWLPILHLIVLPWRLGRVTKAYGTIWTDQGSPLLVHTSAFSDELAKVLGANWKVVPAMRYGRPSIQRGVELLAAEGIQEITLLPLFPQWSDTTNGTIHAEATRVLERKPGAPTLRMIGAYPTHPAMIERLAQLTRTATKGRDMELYVFSFHGIPESYVRDGDPYLRHCQETAAALAKELGLGQNDWELTFQSRFGSEPWLAPSTQDRVPELARQGVRGICVLTPGFPCDCLETLEEIGGQLAAAFRSAGGQTFVRVSCPNGDPKWAAAMAELVQESAPVESQPAPVAPQK